MDRDNLIVAGTTKSLAARFHALFAGNERAHGTYGNIAPDRTRSDGKQKGKALTLREPVTVELWAADLAGTYGLGIIPIRDDDTVVFGAVDIDVYADLSHAAIVKRLAAFKLPLIVCRSKSGGAHLFLFAAEPVAAADMQRRLQEIAARLGFGTAEVFPKQTAVKAEDGDLASWINMPYFACDATTRFAINTSGDAMSAEEFLAAAEAARQPASWFAGSLPRTSDALPDGPPCLQHLMEIGFPRGSWNTGMFNLGVYCRKAQPDNWKGHLVQLNAINFPPDKWPSSDLNGIQKSLSKKDYAYQCNNPTLAQHCDRATCRTRKYGVGTGGANSLPVLSSLTMLQTDPPLWFLEIEGHRIKFTTAELLNPLAFQEKCCNYAVIVPVVGRAQWVEHLRLAMSAVNKIPVGNDADGDDGSAKAHFKILLEKFCTSPRQARYRDEILLGKPFTEGDKTSFQVIDLINYLADKNFKDFRRNEVVIALRDLGGVSRKARFGSQAKEIRFWELPSFATAQVSLTVPPELMDGSDRPF